MLKRWAMGVAIGVLIGSLYGCLFFGHKKSAAVAPTTETEPDKILFERGVAEIGKGHYDVGRLTLQTLINTYPDSEYLSKAKLQIADSFYKQGGTTGLVQAKAEYWISGLFSPPTRTRPKRK
ncbi:MAG: outer membrane protein assembly factor BamD [Terriglobia bacterium]